MKRSIIYINDNIIRLRHAISEKDSQNILKEEKIDVSSLKKETITAYITSFFKDNKITPENIILGIPRAQVSIKYLTLPASEDKEIKKMAEYELNNLFPLLPEELVIDYAVINKETKGYSELIIFAAPRENITNQLLTLKQAGITPDSINVSTVSLFNQFCRQNKPQANYLIVYFDDSFMETIFVKNSRLAFSRGITVKQIAGTADIIKEIGLTAAILKDKGESIDKIILGGSGRDLESFAKDLEGALEFKVKINGALDVLHGFAINEGKSTLSINLLPENVKIKKAQSTKRKLLLHFGALLLLNLSLIVNIAYLNLKVKKEYLNQLKAEIRKIAAPASNLQKKRFGILMLKNYFNSNRLALNLLSEIYRIAPEQINLSVLDIGIRNASGIMIVSGQAKDSETALRFSRAIQNSKLFKKADVLYIKKLSSSSQEQLVDFEINAGF